MNKERRKKLDILGIKMENIVKEIEDIKNQLNDVLVDEENAFDSMPEGLQVSERGMNSEESIDLMYDIKDKLEQCIDNINDIINM